MKINPRQLWFSLPVMLAFFTDMTVTLMGQPAAYWAGDFSKVNEENPVMHFVLSIHPVVFGICAVAAFAVLVFLIGVLPLRVAKIGSLFLLLTHTMAAYTWMWHVLYVDYFLRHALLIVPAILLEISFAKAGR